MYPPGHTSAIWEYGLFNPSASAIYIVTMVPLTARGPGLPNKPKTERDRIRELAKYYCAFTHPNDDGVSDGRAAPSGNEQPGAAYLSPDITLNALAQLGVLRFGCNRSFISIIDGENQHIIAETTSSISLRHGGQHLPDDGLYLGYRTLNLSWGVCPHTIKLFTAQDTSFEVETENVSANRSRYIIRNFADEKAFNDRPYVVDWPHMRFYAEVPLLSASGHVLGSYCIVDDKSRPVFGDSEIALLQEIADSVAEYLEKTRIVHFHRRAEKLVKGVTDLVTNHPEPEAVLKRSSPLADIDIHDPDPDAGSAHVATSSTQTEDQGSSLITSELSSLSFGRDMSRSTEPTSVHSNIGSSSAGLTPLFEKPQNEFWNPEDINSPGENDIKSQESNTPSSHIISRSIASIFSRASIILRDSMELDGVLFADAFKNNSGFQSPGPPGVWEPSPKHLHSSLDNSLASIRFGPKHDVIPSHESKASCEILGHALRNSSKAGCDNGDEVALTEELLERMITAFPQGQVFNLNDRLDDSHYLSYQSGGDDSVTELKNLQEITSELAKYLPKADSALFSPLWDWNKSRWLAGTLLWTGNMHRALGMDELGFFRAFSNSVISEVARVNWDSLEKSKSDFISSISHEFRSPLHGILGNTELLRATTLEPAQSDMVKMIESCGMTLLDVVNHLLDFTKINTLTTNNPQGSENTEDNLKNLISDFELDVLIEEVTEILCISQTPEGKDPQSEARGWLSSPAYPTSRRYTDQVSVVVRVDGHNSWKVRSVAGAWRRIVMSLVGNSLKWTHQGLIEISLSSVSTGIDSEPFLAHLSVTDTGSGISSDYLRHSVFSPFTQEDSLSEGVGLGLSLVRKLVTLLGGHIDVKSEVGVGTQVDAYIPVHRCDIDSQGPVGPYGEIPDSIPAIRACLIGFNDCPDLNEMPTGILNTEAKRKLSIQSSLSNVFLGQPAWSVSFAESVEKAHGDVLVIEDTKLQQLMQDHPGYLAQSTAKSFIVLGERKSIAEDQWKHKYVYVSQPYGPHKVIKAINLALMENSVSIVLPKPGSYSAEAFNANYDEDTHIEHLISARNGYASTPELSTKPDQMHVLIVDDNKINVKILATFVHKLGCTYETATNGLNALNLFKESDRPFTYVLMDLSMPVMDGLVSTRKIREFEKDNGLSASCIMAVTGVASSEIQQQARMAGLDDYLVKPVSLEILKEKLKAK
ncbi:hypothetical protein N7526_000301 [Penicillium atrosanguineum]|nr:hypothetical protein N7526_000301 [Penicillium atrosanguineum]